MEFEKELAGARVLVVGGAGFVGSNLVKTLLSYPGCQEVTVVDNFLSSERENLPQDKRLQLIEGSIAEEATLEQLEDRWDYLFHLACYHGNQSSIHDPLADHANNTLTTLKLFERIKTFSQLKKVVYSGAGCAVAEKTYGEPEASEEVDVASLHMDSPYSISKIVGEFYSCYYHRQEQLPVVRARFQNVFGPGEVLGAGQWRGTPATVWRNVVPTFIYRALNQEELPLENGGESSRDFIFVEDIVRGLLRCAFHGRAGEAYNLASGKETTIKELALMVNALTENKGGVKLLPRRSWDQSGRRYGSTKKSQKELGFEAQTSVEEGLHLTVQWTTEQMERIQETMAKHQGKMVELAHTP